MRRFTVILSVYSLICVASTAAVQDTVPAGALPSVNEIVTRMNQSEATLITNMRNWRPIIEVYVQSLRPDDELGFVPIQDTYFLGRFDWDQGPKFRTLSGKVETAKRRAAAMKASGLEFLPDGFAAAAAPDWAVLDVGRYEFKLLRREFLGEVRTFVLDVKPIRNERGGFSGRIWVEDLGYNIVRYNGINRRVEQSIFRKQIPVHVDGWRVNVLPGLWLPAYLYFEETALQEVPTRAKSARFKGQVRLWGFDPRRAAGQGQLTSIAISEPQIQDHAQSRQLSPLASQRQWEHEAEANVLERLEQAGMLGTLGEVEKILETVINNLIVTNELDLGRNVKARVLLTSPLESFTVGHTIVLSRGLIDVLPDEASLAMMLAHELSHIALGHPLIDTQFAFADRMMVGDDDLLRVLKLTRSAQVEAAADARAAEVLKKSPYGEKLSDAGLFLRVVADRAKYLPNLIQPHIGNHLADATTLSRMASVMQQSPELAPDQLDQIPALPLGARLVLDPWTSRLELSRAATPQLKTIREKVPLAVTPLMPFLKYVEAPAATR